MAEIDGLPVSSLTDRYGVNRSQVYVRLEALKKLDPSLAPVRQGRKAFVDQQLLDYLDSMAALIQQGFTTEQAAEKVLGVRSQPDTTPDSLTRQDRTLDLNTGEMLALLLANMQQPPQPEDDLAVFRKLQELADNDWRPSTSQLCKILGLSALSDHEFERYGFRFIRSGKNGAESAWKVEKL